MVKADTSLFNRSILQNLNQARKSFIQFAREHFPQSVVNSETGREIGISRTGLDKFLSGRIPYEKYASGFHIPELIERAHLVAQASNDHTEQIDGIPTYEYYDSPITIESRDYMAHIRVRNTRMGDRYYGHTISEVEDIKIEPSARTSVPGKTQAVQPVNAIDGSINSIPQTALGVNPESGDGQSVGAAQNPFIAALRRGVEAAADTGVAVDTPVPGPGLNGEKSGFTQGEVSPLLKPVLKAQQEREAARAAARDIHPVIRAMIQPLLNKQWEERQSHEESARRDERGGEELERQGDEAQVNEGEIEDKVRHIGKSILAKGKVTGFEGLPQSLQRSFNEGIKTASPELQVALRQWKRKAQYVTSAGKRSFYRTGKQVVSIGRNGTPSTVAHELFHWVDDGGRISSQLLEPLMQDYIALQMASDGDVKAYLMGHYPEAFRVSSSMQRVVRPEYRGIADILNGLSGGEEHYGYGHSRKYWEKPGTLELEAWAQFGRHQYDNLDAVLKMFQELFPNFYESAMIKLKELR